MREGRSDPTPPSSSSSSSPGWAPPISSPVPPPTDVYLNERTLTYCKQPCTAADAETWFLLQVIPVDPAHLPAHRKQYRFDNLDFHFRVRGSVRLGDQCIAIAQLPDYPIGRIRVGQWIAKKDSIVWEAEFPPGR